MNLKQRLQQRFPAIAPTRLPGGYDRVGDIAILSIVPELQPLEEEIGAIVLAGRPDLRVAARRAGEHEGEQRIRPLTVIAGEQRLTTVHRENSVQFHLDLGQVYFSVRSAHERARIAAQVRAGESVAVLCSGAGPLPLIIGRHSRAGEIVGIELNPVAHVYALRNLAANRGVTRIRFLEGDAARVLPALDRRFDRIALVLPHGGEHLLPCALEALKPGGMLHFYGMQAKGREDTLLAELAAACGQRARRPRLVRSVVCGHCGPKAFQALRAAGVTMYTTTAATVSEALALYREGKLTEATGADAPRGRRR